MPSFSQFFPVFPSFSQFFPIFITFKTSIFLRARRKNDGAPDRQEETHKKYIIHFAEIQFSPVLPNFAQFYAVLPSFAQFYPVFISFAEFVFQFHPVSPSFAQFRPVFPSFPQFSLVFPSFHQFSPVFISFAEFFFQFHPVSPSFAQFCPVLPSFLQFSPVNFYPIFINFAEFSSNLIQFQPTPSFAQFCPVLSNFVQFSQVSLRNFATFFPNNFGFLFLHQCLSLYSVLHFVLLNLFFFAQFCPVPPKKFQFSIFTAVLIDVSSSIASRYQIFFWFKIWTKKRKQLWDNLL